MSVQQQPNALNIYDRFDINGNPLLLQNNKSSSAFVQNSYSSLDLYHIMLSNFANLSKTLEKIETCDTTTEICTLQNGQTIDMNSIANMYIAIIKSYIAADSAMDYSARGTPQMSQEEIDVNYAEIKKKKKTIDELRKDLDENLKKHNIPTKEIRREHRLNTDTEKEDSTQQLQYTLYIQALLVILLCSVVFMFFVHID